MKKIISLLLMMMLLSVFTVVAAPSTDVRITLLNQDPGPVQPGEAVDLRFQVRNLGVDQVKALQIEILPEFPLSMFSGDSVQSVEGLAGFSVNSEAKVLRYRLKVDEGASTGDIGIKVRYKIDNQDWVELDEFSVSIDSKTSILSIDKIEFEPKQFVPGQVTKVDVKLKNNVDTVFSDVSFKLDLGLQTLAGASSAGLVNGVPYFEALPFAPVDSSTEKKVKTIRPNEVQNFQYEIITYPDAVSKVYKIPIQIKYLDSSNNEIVQNDFITFIVGSEPDLSILVDSFDYAGPDGMSKLSVRIVNKGLSDIKFANVFITQQDNYEIVGNKEVYVGNIDSDDFETADFDIKVKSLSPEQVIEFPLTVEYKDSNNNDYSIDETLSQKVFSFKSNQGGSSTVILVVIVIAIVGYFFYRRSKKK